MSDGDPFGTAKTIKSLTDKMGFGKHKDRTVQWVIEHALEYMEWAVENVKWFELDEEANEYFENIQDAQERDDDVSNEFPGWCGEWW